MGIGPIFCTIVANTSHQVPSSDVSREVALCAFAHTPPRLSSVSKTYHFGANTVFFNFNFKGVV